MAAPIPEVSIGIVNTEISDNGNGMCSVLVSAFVSAPQGGISFLSQQHDIKFNETELEQAKKRARTDLKEQIMAYAVGLTAAATAFT